jgi:hypothetical protein
MIVNLVMLYVSSMANHHLLQVGLIEILYYSYMLCSDFEEIFFHVVNSVAVFIILMNVI